MTSTLIYDVNLSNNQIYLLIIELNDNHNPLLPDNDDFRLSSINFITLNVKIPPMAPNTSLIEIISLFTEEVPSYFDKWQKLMIWQLSNINSVYSFNKNVTTSHKIIPKSSLHEFNNVITCSITCDKQIVCQKSDIRAWNRRVLVHFPTTTTKNNK